MRSLPVSCLGAVIICDLATYAVLVVDVENLDVSAEPDASLTANWAAAVV